MVANLPIFLADLIEVYRNSNLALAETIDPQLISCINRTVQLRPHSHDAGDNGEKCDGRKILASAYMFPAKSETVGNVTITDSLQDFDSKEMYVHLQNRSVSFRKRQKCSVFKVFDPHDAIFQIVPVRIPFLKSAVLKLCRQKKDRPTGFK